MKIGLLGTGMVARALAAKLVELGHAVTVGARTADSASLAPFRELPVTATGAFADAAAAGELVICAVNGEHTLDALRMAGAGSLAGKPLLELGNLLDASQGMPPKSLASADNCLGVRVQQEFPAAHVVKSLNTMNCSVMVDPGLVAGDHAVFVSGDDAEAKARVKALLREFSWRDEQIVDLGGIETAVGPEMAMALWLNVMIARGGFDAGPFNWGIHTAV